MTTPAAFSLRNVSVRYGAAPVLHDISLEIAQGESVAIVGPSGSGKTTLLRLLNGSVRPSGGAVTVRGRALTDLGTRDLRRTRASIGFVHQDLRLVPNIRAIHNVTAGRLGTMSLAASLRAMLYPSKRLQLDAHEVLERVGIGEKLHQRTDRLSGGEQQRVAIARALFQEPRVLLADEPVSSVDPARARDVLQLLTRLSRESHLTLCVSLHNLELAREFFQRFVGLRAGRLVFDTSSSELRPEAFESLYRLTGGERAGRDD
jgi:phosphonate transport system ATP-binding protein